MAFAGVVTCLKVLSPRAAVDVAVLTVDTALVTVALVTVALVTVGLTFMVLLETDSDSGMVTAADDTVTLFVGIRVVVVDLLIALNSDIVWQVTLLSTSMALMQATA